MSGKDNAGTIRLEITDFADWGAQDGYKNAEQKPSEIGHVEWILGACVDSSAKTNNVKHLGVYVKCKASSRSNLWSCNASVRFSLVRLNSNDKNDAFSMDFEQKFDMKNKILEVPIFKNWQEAICYDNNFVLDENAVIEAHITVNNVVGIHEKILETFVEPREDLTDVVLVVEGKKVHVGKQILSQYSEYFHSLFYSKLDKCEGEIVLENVTHSHFIDLLNMIYPTHQIITAENVAHILKLADRFKVPHVVIRCENFLISSKDIHLVDKFKHAETYKLSELQDHCLDQISKNEDVLALNKHKNYAALDGTTHTVILQKLIDVLNG